MIRLGIVFLDKIVCEQETAGHPFRLKCRLLATAMRHILTHLLSHAYAGPHSAESRGQQRPGRHRRGAAQQVEIPVLLQAQLRSALHCHFAQVCLEQQGPAPTPPDPAPNRCVPACTCHSN